MSLGVNVVIAHHTQSLTPYDDGPHSPSLTLRWQAISDVATTQGVRYASHDYAPTC
jgi:hypothetical protein